MSLPLGTSPISPLEMAGAYASIANDGLYNVPFFISRIENASGDVLYEHARQSKRVMSVQTARQAIVAMKAVVTGGTATKARLDDREAAGKTGTTEKHGDAWFVGFTPQLATAVWMGSPEGQIPMNSVGGINVYGGTFPALIWHELMTGALAGQPVLSFEAPGPTRAGKLLEVPKGVEQTVDTAPGSSDVSTTTLAGGVTVTSTPESKPRVTLPDTSTSTPSTPTTRRSPPTLPPKPTR
jgi:penicillin-binding protein 1A